MGFKDELAAQVADIDARMAAVTASADAQLAALAAKKDALLGAAGLLNDDAEKALAALAAAGVISGTLGRSR